VLDKGRKMASASLDEKLTVADQILLNQVAMCKTLEGIKDNTFKQFAGLIGVIMALIGSKLIGTPWYIDLAVILCLVSGTFLTMTLIHWWKDYSWSQRAVRIAFSILCTVSSVAKIWIYQAGEEPAPVWFSPTTNILMTLVAISMIWASWTMKPRKIKK
jgi:hypothetical protein